MAAPYLDVAGLKAATIAPASYVDAIELEEPGWVLGRLATWSRWIDARLRKRYAVPFVAPVPETVQAWLAAILTWEVYLKRGVNPLDAQIADVKSEATLAKTEIAEAANGNTGLFELPLRADKRAGGVIAPAPMSLTEVSPYTWTDAQIETAELNGELDGRR